MADAASSREEVDIPAARRLIADKIIEALATCQTDEGWFDIVGGSIRDGILEPDHGEWAGTDSDIDLSFKLCGEREERWKELEEAYLRNLRDFREMERDIDPGTQCTDVGLLTKREKAAEARLVTVRLNSQAELEDGNAFRNEAENLKQKVEEADLVVCESTVNADSYGIWLKRWFVSSDSVVVQIDLSFRPTYHLDFDINSLSWNQRDGLSVRDTPREDFEDAIAKIRANIRNEEFNVIWFSGWNVRECQLIFCRIRKMEKRGWECLNAEGFEKCGIKSENSLRVLREERMRRLDEWEQRQESLQKWPQKEGESSGV